MKISPQQGFAVFVPSEYGGFGTVVEAADPVSDSSAWHAPVLSYGDVLHRYGWDDAAYNEARAFCGFPAPHKSGLGPKSLSWQLEKIVEWENRIRVLARKLR
jgi:hypothetical protein